MTLPNDILLMSPEEAARRIALELLEEARSATARLDDEDDIEALHDFRVAIRRLRSSLRAWRPHLEGSVSKAHREALRDLQNATAGGRDAEVALAWLAEQREGLRPNQYLGYEWMVEQLEARLADATAHLREHARREFQRIHGALHDRLEVMTLEMNLVHAHAGATFAEVLGARARESVREVAERLAEVRSSEDRQAIHGARIACKRLRYLLEPARIEGTSVIVERCKRLQDVLEELTDAHVLREELGKALGSAPRVQRETRHTSQTGLLELTRRMQARIGALFAQFEEEWVAGDSDALVNDVEELAARLEHCPNFEIERRYLLRGLPAPPEGEVLEIDQGWLPGERFRERIRRERGRSGTRYYRTIKFGEGVRRIEIEEPTTETLFDVLWPLTAGCRIHKRRYKVRDGDLVWEVDEFLDRDLVLAEVELASTSERPPLPDWLAPHVVREVTDDSRYTNLKLAR